MRRSILLLATAAAFATPVGAGAHSDIPAAIYTDPAPDAENPPRMETLHIPSGGVEINAIAYVASGPGPHPTLLICHGWPGNEKNLDLAQAARRAGWNAVAFNYRGSWGSPGSFRFAQNPEDAAAVLAYLRDPENAAKLGVDTSRMAIIGHSMGGWVSAMTAGQDSGLVGMGLISAANMGWVGRLERGDLAKRSAGNAETLADTSPEMMADELIANQAAFDFLQYAPQLAGKSNLVLSSDDDLAFMTDALVEAIRKSGGTKVTAIHEATDHSWSGKRITLQAHVLRWLQSMEPVGR
ncbi:alpha/beta hydrolase family protein [Qipengyuania sp. RANM35]|uniref:alpha/beta hydrolase family protein n=1 Tax=Qipengyuania sp. RANM35 TaxID=3068635 RepID=UPI0034DB4819